MNLIKQTKLLKFELAKKNKEIAKLKAEIKVLSTPVEPEIKEKIVTKTKKGK